MIETNLRQILLCTNSVLENGPHFKITFLGKIKIFLTPFFMIGNFLKSAKIRPYLMYYYIKYNVYRKNVLVSSI